MSVANDLLRRLEALGISVVVVGVSVAAIGVFYFTSMRPSILEYNRWKVYGKMVCSREDPSTYAVMPLHFGERGRDWWERQQELQEQEQALLARQKQADAVCGVPSSFVNDDFGIRSQCQRDMPLNPTESDDRKYSDCVERTRQACEAAQEIAAERMAIATGRPGQYSNLGNGYGESNTYTLRPVKQDNQFWFHPGEWIVELFPTTYVSAEEEEGRFYIDSSSKIGGTQSELARLGAPLARLGLDRHIDLSSVIIPEDVRVYVDFDGVRLTAESGGEVLAEYTCFDNEKL